MTISDVLSTYHISQSELSRRLGIPLRTVQHWAEGTRAPAPWVLELIKYRLAHDEREG